MIGESSAIGRVRRVIERMAGSDATVLIEGETGTGKELVARAIHYGGARAGCPFVPVNCGAIPDTLIENELFGHHRGAYTDARSDSDGLIACAEGGSLFLDEVEVLSAKAQVVLLRFLQDQKYRPVGGRDQRSADVRIVAASNASLERLAQQGAFRLDLLYRLKLLHLTLPPLREREGDIALLARSFVSQCVQRYGGEPRSICPSSLEWMAHYPWPGNVRELEHRVYSAFLLGDDPVIRLDPPEGFMAERRAVPDRRRTAYAGVSFSAGKAAALEAFERGFVATLLRDTRGNITRAARLAGKERRAFGKLVKKLGMTHSFNAD